MKSTTILAVSLGSIFGLIFLVLSLAACRFQYRKNRKGRSSAKNPEYESKLNEQDDQDQKRWFGGKWGITPVAERGVGGTRQYLSGWFALDSPMGAGWTASDADGTFTKSTYGTDQSTQSTWRESHFSRASRASRRSTKSEKKKPRPSRTTELGMLENDDQGDEKAKKKEGSSATGVESEGEEAELIVPTKKETE